MPCIGTRQEANGDDMMGEHLPMILSTLFHIENEDLLYGKGALNEIVELSRGKKDLSDILDTGEVKAHSPWSTHLAP